ncbi:MAG: formylglycine-generating enzyme family protein [Thermoguttaceae bacterium]|jgi:formylglycine-generating enzyme required for sulfatase activity|nr:formylglycine-generating enzyme family protein [Thermoguttaceae bacterium]
MNIKTWVTLCLATVMTASVAGCGPSAERADADPATAPLDAAPLGVAEGAEAPGEGDTAGLSPAQHEATKAAAVPVDITNSIGMKLVLIPAGEFMMGSGKSPEALAAEFEIKAGYFEDEHPQHRVRLTKPFYLGNCEVTQGQWERVMGTRPWSDIYYMKEGSEYAATHVSWEDAVAFCRKLSAKEGKEYRLPTEAEWEWACRAGTTTAYHFGDDGSRLSDYASWGRLFGNGNCVDLVGQKKPNPWGLYDMHGNVWEWCADWFDYYVNSPVEDPQGPTNGSIRVARGGSWESFAENLRSAHRGAFTPDYRHYALGFRLALVPADESSK